jgi:hypothetical protein
MIEISDNTATDLLIDLAADADGRRSFLDDDLADRPLDVDVSDVTTPTEVETLEWFATAEDICRAHAGLAERGQRDPVVREVLAANPGVPVDTQAWAYVGFKGGSEPGLFALSWYLETAAGDGHVLVTIAVDPEALVDDMTLVQLGSAGIDLLARR